MLGIANLLLKVQEFQFIVAVFLTDMVGVKGMRGSVEPSNAKGVERGGVAQVVRAPA
jgi:hypothetical protein